MTKKIQTDEELLKSIKLGSELAENELLTRYKDLVVKIARGFFIVGGDLEDLVQEGMIGLYKAMKSFSCEKEASFKTFAILCIKHQIQSAIKRANTNKNKPLSSAVSLQSYASENQDSLDFLPIELVAENSPAEKAIDRENFESLKLKIKNSLSSRERKVLLQYLQGYSYKEISENLNTSPKSVDNSLARIKVKLKKELKSNKTA